MEINEHILKELINDNIEHNIIFKIVQSMDINSDECIYKYPYLDYFLRQIDAKPGQHNNKLKLEMCNLVGTIESNESIITLDAVMASNNDIDINQYVIKSLIESFNYNIAQRIINNMLKLGSLHAKKYYTLLDDIKSVMYRFLNKVYVKKIKVTTFRDIIGHVNAAAFKIATGTRRGLGNVAITNPRYASLIMDDPSFISIDQLNNTNNTKMYLIGKLNNIDIIVDPNMKWNDCRIIVARKTGTNDTGIKFIYNSKQISFTAMSEINFPTRYVLNIPTDVINAGPDSAYLNYLVLDFKERSQLC